jgi:hypothetical protein
MSRLCPLIRPLAVLALGWPILGMFGSFLIAGVADAAHDRSLEDWNTNVYGLVMMLIWLGLIAVYAIVNCAVRWAETGSPLEPPGIE